METIDLMECMKTLLNIPSPTGDTERALDFVEKSLKSLGVEIKKTARNAIIATIPGRSPEGILFSGHVDTLGLMVKEILDNGRLRFSLLGGFAPVSVDGENVTVKTMDGKEFRGTALYEETSVHVYDTSREGVRTVKNMEIRLDEVVETKQDVLDLGIDVGNFIALDPRTEITPSGYIKSRHLDDKACVAIMLKVVEELASRSTMPQKTIHFYFSNYEEVGFGSNAAIPEGVTEFIAVDMAAMGRGQNSSERAVTICALDSSGPYDLSIRRKLTRLAKAKKIPYREDIYPHYGSDASTALYAGWDLRAGLIGPGIDASHSYERGHVEGFQATIDLMLAYIDSEEEKREA